MIVDRFPDAWKTAVTVTRGGRDAKGNPVPGEDHVVRGCLIGWRSTDDPVDRSDLTEDRAVLYADDPLADIQDDDLFDVPVGPWPSGKFQTDGTIKPWPMGLEVPLRRRS